MNLRNMVLGAAFGVLALSAIPEAHAQRIGVGSFRCIAFPGSQITADARGTIVLEHRTYNISMTCDSTVNGGNSLSLIPVLQYADGEVEQVSVTLIAKVKDTKGYKPFGGLTIISNNEFAAGTVIANPNRNITPEGRADFMISLGPLNVDE